MTTPKDLIEGQLPSYFLEQYPQFTKFVQEYYNFLESNVVVLRDNLNLESGDTLYGSLSKAKGIVKIVANDRVYFDYETQENSFYQNEFLINGFTGEIYFTHKLFKNIFQYMADIEENNVYETSYTIFQKYFKRNVSLDHSIFRKLDPKTLTKRILDYYKNRGTENSYYWFFRIFFDETIELYYPKVDILKLSDSGYYRQNLIEINYQSNAALFTGTRIYGKKSKASAIARQVVSKTYRSRVRIYLDLIYMNGKFVDGDQLIAYNTITSEPVVTGGVKESIVDLEILDGGIGHQVGDGFSFNDGRAEITKVEEYSITRINVSNKGLCYSIGDPVIFENAFTGATAYAEAYVDDIDVNPTLTSYFNSRFNILANQSVSHFANVNMNQPLFPGAGQNAGDSSVNTVLPAGMFPTYEVGGIKSIRFNKSGLNYNFAPPTKIINQLPETQSVIVFDVYFKSDPATQTEVDKLDPGTTVIVGEVVAGIDTPLDTAFFVEDVIIEGASITIGGLTFLSENFSAKRFVTGRTQTDLENKPAAYMTFTDAGGNTVRVDVEDTVGIQPLNNTAEVESVLGDGIAGYKILEPGLSAEAFHSIVFRQPRDTLVYDDNAGKFKDYYDPRIQHGLDATLGYIFDVHHDPYEEYKNTQSQLSWDKYFFDNYYYQWYSYEIITKLPASKIEPLLLDELHPAGFLAFVRNKFEDELQHRIQAFELPEIEIESQGYCTSVIYPYMEQEWENFGELTITQILQKEIETDLMHHEEATAHEYTELDIEGIADIYQAFKYYIDDSVIPPDMSLARSPWRYTSIDKRFGSAAASDRRRDIVQRTIKEEQILISAVDKSFFEFNEIEEICKIFNRHHHIDPHLGLVYDPKAATDEEIVKAMMYRYGDEYNTYFDPRKLFISLSTFELNQYKNLLDDYYTRIIEALVEVSPGVYNLECGVSREFKDSRPNYLEHIVEPHVSTDNVSYDLLMAVQSFSKLINVEDKANWISETIGTRSGPIDTFKDKTIHQHRIDLADIKTYVTGSNPGGMVIARDPFTAVITSANTIGATFGNTSIHFANSLGDWSQSVYAVAADLSSIDLRFNTTNITYAYTQASAYMPVVTGNSITKQGSYLPTAEIFTERGWMQFQDLKYGIKVAEVRPDGVIRFAEPLEIYSTHFDGNVYRYTDNNLFSITVISEQELALQTVKNTLYKKKAKDVKVNRSSDGIALVDDLAIKHGKNPIIGSIPLKGNIEVHQSRYSGPLFCVNLNNYEAHAKMKFDVTDVDMNELELHYMIDNTYTLPEMQTNESRRISVYNDPVTVEIDQQFTLPVEIEPIVFDYQNPKGLALHANTANQANFSLTSRYFADKTRDYTMGHYQWVRNPYPEVARTEIFFLNANSVPATGVPYGLVPSILALPRTMSPSLEHVILAQPKVTIGLLQQREQFVPYGTEIFHYANTTNTHFSELGVESYQWSEVDVDETFKGAPTNVTDIPESLLLIETYTDYWENLELFDEFGKPTQPVIVQNIQLNVANTTVSINDTGQLEWQRNYSVLQLNIEDSVTILGFEQIDKNKISQLSFETAIPALKFENNKPATYSKVNLYNVGYFELPDVVAFTELRRHKQYGPDDLVGFEAFNSNVANDPRNRSSQLISTAIINAFQRNGQHGRLNIPMGFNSLFAGFGDTDSSFDLNTLEYQPGELVVIPKLDYINITNIDSFKINPLFDEKDFYVLGDLVVDPNIEVNTYFAAEINVQNADVIHKREWKWDFTYDLYTRQEYITEGFKLDASSSDVVIVDQEREFDMMMDAGIWMPDKFDFEREMINLEYGYGNRKKRPVSYDELPLTFDATKHKMDVNYRLPHKGETFWDRTNFEIKVEIPLYENWYHWDNELTAKNVDIRNTLVSGGQYPELSYEGWVKDTANTTDTVLGINLEVNILDRYLFFDYDQKIKNDYRDWTKKYFDPWLSARSKAWLGDLNYTAKALSEPTIYLAPIEKKIPVVEFIESVVESNTVYLDATSIDDERMDVIHVDFHIEDRNIYFQTTDIIKPWIRVRIYDWFDSKFAEYFGDKIPTVKVTVVPTISTDFTYSNIPTYETSTTIYFPNTTFLDATTTLTPPHLEFKSRQVIRDRNRLFAKDRIVTNFWLNDQIRNAFIPQEIVEYYKDALPGVQATPFPVISYTMPIANTPTYNYFNDGTGFEFDQIIYHPNTVFYDATSSLHKDDNIKIDQAIVNRNTTFALMDVYHHRWGNRYIKEFMKTAIRLRDWGKDTIPSATAVNEPKIIYKPQLYLHYPNQTGKRNIDDSFEGSNFSEDVSDYYIQDTVVPLGNTVFIDATSWLKEDNEVESDYFVQDSFSTFGLSGVMDWRWYNVRIKEFMKKFIILRYWAKDTIPSVTAIPQPEIEYYPQLYFHYGPNGSKDQYVDENFEGTDFSWDISDYYIQETIVPIGNTTFLDLTHEGYGETKIKEDVNIKNSFDVFALNKKITPFLNYAITGGQKVQRIQDWGGEAIPSVFATSFPNINYSPQLYGHYDQAISQFVDDSPNHMLPQHEIQDYYSIETTLYSNTVPFADATATVEYPRLAVHTEKDSFSRQKFLARRDRVWGSYMYDEIIEDYLLTTLHDYNLQHMPQVRAVSIPNIIYKPQLYGHYDQSISQHLNDSPEGLIPQQSIQKYFNSEFILPDTIGTTLYTSGEAQLEFNKIYTEKDHISDRFVVRANEVIANKFEQRIQDYEKFIFAIQYGEITRTAKTNTYGEATIVIPREITNPEHLEKPYASPFLEKAETILTDTPTSMFDAGIYAETAIVEYTKFDDMRVEETFLNLNNEITDEFLDKPITHRELIKQTRADLLRAHHTVDATPYYTFSMYNEFGEEGELKDILQTKLKEVTTTLYNEAEFVDGTLHIDRDFTFEFEYTTDIKTSEQVIGLDQPITERGLGRQINTRSWNWDILDKLTESLHSPDLETMVNQVFEMKEIRFDLDSNTSISTTYNLENYIETSFNVFSEPLINNINSKMLRGDDMLISNYFDSYLDVDIYKMQSKRIKERKVKDDRKKYLNTSAKINSIRTEGFTWNISDLNSFNTNYVSSNNDGRMSITHNVNIAEILDDFRVVNANTTHAGLYHQLLNV